MLPSSRSESPSITRPRIWFQEGPEHGQHCVPAGPRRPLPARRPLCKDHHGERRVRAFLQQTAFHHTGMRPRQTSRRGVDRHKLLETNCFKESRPREIESPLTAALALLPSWAHSVDSGVCSGKCAVSCVFTARTRFFNNKCHRGKTRTQFICSGQSPTDCGPRAEAPTPEARFLRDQPSCLSAGWRRGRGEGEDGGVGVAVTQGPRYFFFSDGNIILTNSFFP